MIKQAILVFFIFLINAGFSQKSSKHEELGAVDWLRDYDAAVEQSKQNGKDILILFQEVPGCATCRNYGHNVLSNPLMVEAIENNFVPLAIFNNLGGKDNEILEKFGEYSWNNPTVRIVNTKEETIVPRISEDYSALTLCSRMIQAISKNKQTIPNYLSLLEQQLLSNAKNRADIYFKVPCFWSGEKTFGNMTGVLQTSSGFSGGFEVVKISYNSDLVSEKEIKSRGNKDGYEFIDPKQVDFVVSDEDVHYYLKNSDYVYLALSDIQKTRVNSALGRGVSPLKYLSPNQLRCWYAVEKSKEGKQPLIKHTFSYAWGLMMSYL